jgi:hypothetical protein
LKGFPILLCTIMLLNPLYDVTKPSIKLRLNLRILSPYYLNVNLQKKQIN